MEEEKISENNQMKKPKEPGIMRMTAHQYEKKINELLEKIDILESRLLIANTQKGYVVTKLKDYEEKNEELSKKYNDKIKENEKLKETKRENEGEINDLKKNNQIFMQRNKERFANINKDLEGKCKEIDKLNKELSQKNEQLNKKYNEKIKENEKLKETKKENENEIKDLKKNNRIFTQRNKEKFADINKSLEGKEKQIDKLNKELNQKDEKLRALSVNHKLNQNERDITKKDLEDQKKINKQQNKIISDLQKQLDIVNIHKKNEGALSLEVEHLKQDNIRLLEMLQESSDPKTRNLAFLDNSSSGGIMFIRPNSNNNRAKSTENFNSFKSIRENTSRKEGNRWIPLEAYECAMEFKNKYNLDMSDIELEQLLISLNKIWQEKLKREINSVKAKYQNEIKELRMKLGMKSSFNEFSLKKENESLKNNLMIARDNLRDNIVMKHKLNEQPDGNEKIKNIFRTTNTTRKNKKCFLSENERLKQKLKENNEFTHHNDYHNGALWMALKTCDEMNKCQKNINDLFGIYEDKVRYSLYGNENDYSYRIKIMDNSVNWLVKNLQDSLFEAKSKMDDWKTDEQRYLNSLGLSMKHIN